MKKLITLTVATLLLGTIPALHHDSLDGFVANEHIDWTGASVDLMTRGNVKSGTDDTTAGVFKAYGAGTEVTDGGCLQLHTAADYDTTIGVYQLNVDEDDLVLKQGATTKLTLSGATGNFTFACAGHDSFTDFAANEHLDWTADQGATNIHAGNLAGSPGFASGVTIGTLTLADGSITDSSNAINFGNEALSTTGTLGAGAITGTSFVIGQYTCEETEWDYISNINQHLSTVGTPSFIKLTLSSADYPVLGVTRTSSETNTARAVIKIVHETSQVAILDGFGTGLAFTVKDVGAESTIGFLAAIRDGADNEGKLQFHCGTDGDEVFMSIDSGGTVDIPVDLTVDTIGEHTAAAGVTIASDNGIKIKAPTGFPRFEFYHVAARKWLIYSDASYKFHWKTDTDIRMTLQQDGNLGIGDTAPGEKLDVAGNTNVTGVYKVDDVQVVGNQEAHIADAPGDTAANNATTINAILTALEAHGLLATE